MAEALASRCAADDRRSSLCWTDARTVGGALDSRAADRCVESTLASQSSSSRTRNGLPPVTRSQAADNAVSTVGPKLAVTSSATAAWLRGGR